MLKKELIGIGISTGYYKKIIRSIVDLSHAKKGGYVCVANVHMIIEAYNDKEFARIVNSADIVTPDGKPLCILLRILYGKFQERVAGMDLLPDLLDEAESEGLSVFFYGGTKKSLIKIEKIITKKNPLLRIAGMYSPPFGDISLQDVDSHIKIISEKDPDIIFFAFGCPKQEKRMSEMKGRLNGIMIGIGGAIPVLAEEKRRAPLWMQKLSLEWMFRLIQEPGRLWKRYLYTNSKFIFLSLLEIFRKKVLKKG